MKCGFGVIMVSTIQSCALVGLNAHEITCEVNLSSQLPAFTLVGLPSSLTQESRERIRAAIVNSGFDWPARKITINLLPANLPKWGSHFELPMALGILSSLVARPSASPWHKSTMAVGELSLTGAIRPCGWLSLISEWMLQQHVRILIAHPDDVEAVAKLSPKLATFCELIGAQSLQDAFQELSQIALRPLALEDQRKPRQATSARNLQTIEPNLELLAKVRGEPIGVAAALIAIAGGHHCLYSGPHGMGKSMIVRAICHGSRPLSQEEHFSRLALRGPFGERISPGSHEFPRPVVCLQTSISRAALEGALMKSGQVIPGELTAAHMGILVADELLELRRDVIEALRQPLDDGFVRLQRAEIRTVLPSQIQLLATTNLCPCGYFGHPRFRCRCQRNRRLSYQRKLSGPLVDRFDLVVVVGKDRNRRLPNHVVSLLGRLLDPAQWKDQISRVWDTSDSYRKDYNRGASPEDLWSEVSCDFSDRGRLKAARVSHTIAALLGERRSARHLNLAVLLREDFRAMLDPVNESVVGGTNLPTSHYI